jgi:mono/diheme cytochrome c family protein
MNDPKKKSHPVLWTVIAVLVVLAAYAHSMIRHGFSAKAEPSGAEKMIARTMRDLAIPSSAKYEKNPLPASADNVHDGMEHFADHCATCHANDGSGQSDIGPNLYPKPPDLRAAETQNLSDGEIFYIIANGVRLSAMPASDHTVEDNWKLVLFIRHLPALTPAEEKQMEQLNPGEEADDHRDNAVAPEHHHHH